MRDFSFRLRLAVFSVSLAVVAATFILPAIIFSTGAGRGPDVTAEGLAGLNEDFDTARYSLAAVIAGREPPPRLFLIRLPADWSQLADVARRKRTFVQILLPLVLRENERIETEREVLLAIAAKRAAGRKLRRAERRALARLAEAYGVEADDLATLEARLDTVPVSLAIAQAAIESGWGTSRFAREGNALFGEWTNRVEEGMRPRRRDPGRRHLVRRFDSLAASVASYLRNLNTHPAYRGLRARRSRLRGQGLEVDGLALAGQLSAYSARGGDYVALLRRVIVENQLSALDRARFTPAAPESRPQIARIP